MATAREQAEHRRFSAQSGSRQYWIETSGAEDEAAARTALLAAAPSTWSGGGVTLYRSDEAEVFEVGDDGPWFGVAKYAPIDLTPLGSGDTGFEFDTTGGTQHLMASYDTVAAYDDGGAVAAAVTDNGKLIGVTEDGIEGVDVPVGQLGYTITKAFSSITQSYIDDLVELTGTVNDATFTATTDDGLDISLAAGENLFLGVRGGSRNGLVVITFLFAASKNKTGLVVGPIAAIAKKGWEYLWVRYKDATVNGMLTKKPRHAYVEKVFLDGDHSLLGLS